MYDPISDLEEWFVENSQPGIAPFSRYDQRGLTQAEVELLQDYQFGGFMVESADVRSGSVPSDHLMALIALVERFSDATNYMVYRGLGGMDVGEDESSYEESAPNSWSLFPSKALRVAVAHSDEPFVILRQRLKITTPSLYLDDWEDEILCPPQTLRIGPSFEGEVNMLSETFKIRVTDCEHEVV